MVPDGLLWHYTSWESYDRIIDSDSILASKRSCLNDAAESNAAVEVLKNYCSQLHHNQLKAVLPPNDRKWIGEAFSSGASNNTCVACFSRAPDLLSQWRAYSRSPIGISLGFDPTSLDRVAAASFDGRLVPCLYTLGEQNALLAPIAHPLIAQWPVLNDRFPNETDDARRLAIFEDNRTTLIAHFGRLSPQIKDATFNEEREVRIVTGAITVKEPKWGFHRAGSMIVPHLPISLTHAGRRLGSLRYVLVGPCAHPDETRSAASHLLAARGINHVDVGSSAIPLRNW